MTEQELNKKLAEWAGFKPPHPKCTEPNHMSLPNEYRKGEYFCVRIPDFTQSLDACFKWLVPERISEVTFMFASNCVSCDIEDLESNFFEGHANTESIEEAWTKSALALCLAVERLIDA